MPSFELAFFLNTVWYICALENVRYGKNNSQTLSMLDVLSLCSQNVEKWIREPKEKIRWILSVKRWGKRAPKFPGVSQVGFEESFLLGITYMTKSQCGHNIDQATINL